MKTRTVMICREDVNNALFPTLWECICEEVGLLPLHPHGQWPESLELTVITAADENGRERINPRL
ncbi:MAG: hypothetical protein H8E94_02420 [Alphaproteobacteria bacterium]|nr:hypothetical protein [Alphaproteobacteria bacterium]